MKKITPINVQPTNKVKKAFFTTLATMTVLSQMITVYPMASFAAEADEVTSTPSPNATEVTNFAALKQAIEADNGITDIVLGADIVMTGGIMINNKKQELTIDGNGHTLTESTTNINGNLVTIYAGDSSTIMTMNIKNMVIKGTHYYSPFTIFNGRSGVTQNFENIDYEGPQFIYNLNGYANFTGINKIVSGQGVNGLGTVQEIGEVTGITISGTFTATHNTTAAYALTMYNGSGGKPYFKIMDGANVDFQANGGQFIYAPANVLDFTVGKNATFNLKTLREVFLYAANSITLDNSSKTNITRASNSSTATIQVANALKVNPKASFVVNQTTGSTSHVIRTTVANATIDFDNPRLVDLNTNGTGAGRIFSAAGKTTINASNVGKVSIFNNTNNTTTADQAWNDTTFSIVQASGQAGTVQAGAISDTGDIQSKLAIVNVKHIKMINSVGAADEAVNALFINNNPASAGIVANQAGIDAAQALIDLITDEEDQIEKAEIQIKLDRAQMILDDVAAFQATLGLFDKEQPTTNVLKETTDQAAIDAAQALVDNMSEILADPLQPLAQDNIDRAQALLNAKVQAEQQQAAELAVKELFVDDQVSTDKLKEETTQDNIDNAQKIIDTITDEIAKAAVQKDLDRAQALLDEEKALVQAEQDRQAAAEKAVQELFQDDKPATDALKAETTQESIDNAQKQVDAVTDEIVKAELQKDLDRAQELLDEKPMTTGHLTPTDFLIGSDKYITGAHAGDVAKISLVVNEVEHKGATVKSDGTFTFYAVDKGIKKADSVFVVAYDRDGNELHREQVKFANVATEGKLTPAMLHVTNDNNITGTYAGDVSKITVTVNDVLYKGGTVANGTFKFYSKDKIKANTDTVVIHAYDAAGELLDTQTLQFIDTVTTTGAIQPNMMVVHDAKYITGTYQGDVKSVRVTVDGQPYKGGTLIDGDFKFYAFDKIQSPDSHVIIEALDANGKILDTKTVQLQPRAK